jgi:hypothetical protein
LFGLFPFLEKFFADAGYQGLRFRKQLAQLLPRLLVEIVKQSDSAKGFEVLPRPLPGSIDTVGSPRISRIRAEMLANSLSSLRSD